MMSLDEVMPERVDISPPFENRRACLKAALALYREAAALVAISGSLNTESSGSLPRNQAICGALVLRLAKWMGAVLRLAAPPPMPDVIHALNRCLFESAVNACFLLEKADDAIFDRFVKSGLGPERETYDIVQATIAARRGVVQPIERRILRSIELTCERSGVTIQDVNKKNVNWAGDTRQRCEAVGLSAGYALAFRIGSHAIHGTWVDLQFHHLSQQSDQGWQVGRSPRRFDARLLTPAALITLNASRSYVKACATGFADTEMLLERIDDTSARLRIVDEEDERLASASQGGS